MEIMNCNVCSGVFLEDSGKCICKEKEIKKLRLKIKDLEKLFYALASGDFCSLSKRLQKKYNEMIERI